MAGADIAAEVGSGRFWCPGYDWDFVVLLQPLEVRPSVPTRPGRGAPLPIAPAASRPLPVSQPYRSRSR